MRNRRSSALGALLGLVCVASIVSVGAATETAYSAQSLLQSLPTPADFVSLSLYSEAYRANSTQPNNSAPSLIVAGKGSKQLSFFELYGDAEALQNSTHGSTHYLNVREAFVANTADSTGFKFSFGRKLQGWCKLDDYWKLGMWQPLFRWNFIDPDVVGLTGFFVSKELQNVQLLAFGSPLYIPELGGQLSVANGSLSSNNRFVTLPPSKVSLLGGMLPIQYQLDQTSTKDIVFHPSGGGMVRVGQAKGTWGKLSYIYEPVPRIMLGYEGYLFPANQNIQVTLHPRVVYQHMAALEAGFTAKKWSSWVSVVGQHPVPDNTPGFWTIEEITPALLATGVVDFEAFGEGQSASHFGLSYLYSTGGASPDQGPLAAPAQSIFESRYPYRSAAMARAAVPLSLVGSKRWEASGRGVYEFTVTGIILSMDLTYKAEPHWQAGLGVDLVGSTSPSAPNGGADFTYLYRSDNRIRGKVSYVF